MGKWLRKAGRGVKRLANKYGDKIKEQVQEQITNGVGNVDWGDTMNAISEKGTACARASQETISICDETASQRQEMIDFASEIRSTFTSLKEDPNALEIIKELTEGSRVRKAMDLAKGLNSAAEVCVEKSIEMVDTMESSMESLPSVVKVTLEAIADDDEEGNEDDDEDEDESLIRDLEKDVEDVQSCIQNIRNLNLATAIKVGMEAFSQLTEKSLRSRALFDKVKGFATDVQGICSAFREMDISQAASKGKEMLHCIGLCELMRAVAEGAGKLLKIIVSLFEIVAEKISVLWTSLAFAKDCMQDSVVMVHNAKTKCTDAKEKSSSLVEQSSHIAETMDSIGTMNRESIMAIKELAQGGAIHSTIDLVKNMDDVVVECSSQVVAMIDRVKEGFSNMPAMLTDGLDTEALGKSDSDPDPIDVDEDVQDLEESRQAIEESDIVSVVVAGRRGFKGVSQKSTICKDALALVNEFASGCSTTLDSFLSVWDLESAAGKVEEMFRLVKLGEMMKQFAQQIKKLLLSILAFLKAAVNKLASVTPNLAEGLHSAQDKLEDLASGAKDKAEDFIKGKLKDNLQFWK